MPAKLPRLKVFCDPAHPCSGRYLVTDRGRPFFYLGDTAWELFHRLTREEAELYLKDRAGKGAEHIRAARGADGSYAFIYLPVPKAVRVNLEKLNGKNLRAWWFNPRNGQTQLVGEFARRSERTFTPPGVESREEDWVLVLDEVGKRYRKPGT